MFVLASVIDCVIVTVDVSVSMAVIVSVSA